MFATYSEIHSDNHENTAGFRPPLSLSLTCVISARKISADTAIEITSFEWDIFICVG